MKMKEVNLVLRSYVIITDNVKHFPNEAQTEALEIRKDIEKYLRSGVYLNNCDDFIQNRKELELLSRVYAILSENYRYFPRPEERKNAFLLRREIECYLIKLS